MSKYQISKKRDFATDITINGDTYAGVHAMPYVTAVVRTPDTVAKGYVRTIDGLTKSAVINNIASANPVQAAGCDFDNTTTISTTEQVLTLTDLKVNEQICRGTVFTTKPGQGMDRNGNLPQAFSDFVLQVVAGKAAQQLEIGIWQGAAPFGVGFLSNDGNQDEDGADNSAMKDFTEVTFANPLDAGDIIDGLKAVYSSAAANLPQMLTKPGFGFYMNAQTYSFYCQALAANTTFQGLGAAGSFDALTYMGFPIYVCPGMFNDVIVATYPENLVFGTNNSTDWTEVRLIPTYQYDGSDNVRIVMNFAVGVQVAVATDGVYGSTVWT